MEVEAAPCEIEEPAENDVAAASESCVDCTDSEVGAPPNDVNLEERDGDAAPEYDVGCASSNDDTVPEDKIVCTDGDDGNAPEIELDGAAWDDVAAPANEVGCADDEVGMAWEDDIGVDEMSKVGVDWAAWDDDAAPNDGVGCADKEIDATSEVDTIGNDGVAEFKREDAPDEEKAAAD